MDSKYMPVRNAWWSVNRPVSASVNSGILARKRLLAKSASTAGSCWPSINACSINRPDTQVMSLATEDNLIPASSSSFSSRWISRPRSRVIAVRARVRSRSWRIGAGGTKEPWTRPCAPSWASHAASETSLLRPGQVLHLSSVDQHHLKVGVLEQVVERLPVIPGGLHHHQTDLFIDQVFPKRQHRICGRAPGAHRLHGFAAPPPGNPDTDLRVPFRHI